MQPIRSILREAVLVVGASVFWALTLFAAVVLFPILDLGKKTAGVLRRGTMGAAFFRTRASPG